MIISSSSPYWLFLAFANSLILLMIYVHVGTVYMYICLNYAYIVHTYQTLSVYALVHMYVCIYVCMYYVCMYIIPYPTYICYSRPPSSQTIHPMDQFFKVKQTIKSFIKLSSSMTPTSQQKVSSFQQVYCDRYTC